MGYGNTAGLWKYLKGILDGGLSIYVTGGVGQKTGANYKYDCHGLIKSYAWTNNTVYGPLRYLGNGLPTDDMISTVYAKAKLKGSIASLPKSGIYCVYLNDEHIAVYNAETGTTIECCAGNTNKVVERKLSFYDNTPYKWNKWSDLYWCESTVANNVSSKQVSTGYVESLSYDNGVITVSGWAFDNETAANLELFIDESTAKIADVVTSLKRLDVNESLKVSEAYTLGFKKAVNVSLTSGKHTLHVKCNGSELKYLCSMVMDVADTKVSDKLYRIQVASHTVKANAIKFANSLKSKTTESVVVSLKDGNYRTMICGNVDKSLVDCKLDSIRLNIEKKAFVVFDDGQLQ